MAVSWTTTPQGVTEPVSRFSHSPISRAFSGLLGALAAYTEAERDISDAASFDPAFASWVQDAEAARARVLAQIDVIRQSASVRAEDLPLKRMARICDVLIQSDTTSEFLATHRLLQRLPALLLCDGTGAVAWHTRQMLRSCTARLDEMAALPSHVDPWEIDAPCETADGQVASLPA